MKQDSIDKCKSCKHYDSEKSNNNWTVCVAPMPMEVLVENSSINCEKYSKKE